MFFPFKEELLQKLFKPRNDFLLIEQTVGNENSPARAYPWVKARGFTALAYFGEFSEQKFSALKGGAYTQLNFCYALGRVVAAGSIAQNDVPLSLRGVREWLENTDLLAQPALFKVNLIHTNPLNIYIFTILTSEDAYHED